MDSFEDVRAEPDPLRRARRAGELITLYTQRNIELARLRKEAIDQLLAQGNLTSVEIARRIGLSKGRVTQIRQQAPPRERAFFGVGPVTVAVPLRAVGGRTLPVIASEDATARDELREFLERQLSFQVDRFDIPVGGHWRPRGDVVAICGPKSSPVTAQAIEHDPLLRFEADASGSWEIRDRSTGAAYASPIDTGHGDADIAYVGRLPYQDAHTMLVIAGVHALGSLGAVEHLRRHLTDIYAAVDTRRFSMVIGSVHETGSAIMTSVLVAPCPHD